MLNILKCSNKAIISVFSIILNSFPLLRGYEPFKNQPTKVKTDGHI